MVGNQGRKNSTLYQKQECCHGMLLIEFTL